MQLRDSLLSLLLLAGGVILAQKTYIYVSDAGNYNKPPWQIIRCDENGANPTVFIDENLAWPQDILFLEDSNQVLISNLNSGKISRYDAENGYYIGDFATEIGAPTRMKVGPDSLLYVLQWRGNGKVLRYHLSGTFVDSFTSRGVKQSIGLDWDEHGNLYVASYGQKRVLKFDTSGVELGIFVDSNLQGPTNIWFDESGDLLVSDYKGTSVKRFNSNGEYLGEFINGLHQSEGVAFRSNGHILLGNGSTHSVREYDCNGNYIGTLLDSSGTNLMNPNAVFIRSIPE